MSRIWHLKSSIAACVVASTLSTVAYPAATVVTDEAPAIAATAIKALFSREFVDDKGEKETLARWRGKILVINFWATWCAPCREEMPYFSQIFGKYADKDVQFVGISSDSRESVETFAKQRAIAYPLWQAGPGAIELSQTLGNRIGALPFTLIVGKDGKPLFAHTGRLSQSDIERFLQTALARNSAKMR